MALLFCCSCLHWPICCCVDLVSAVDGVERKYISLSITACFCLEFFVLLSATLRSFSFCVCFFVLAHFCLLLVSTPSHLCTKTCFSTHFNKEEELNHPTLMYTSACAGSSRPASITPSYLDGSNLQIYVATQRCQVHESEETLCYRASRHNAGENGTNHDVGAVIALALEESQREATHPSVGDVGERR